MLIRIETDRGHGFQTRSEGHLPDSVPMGKLRDHAERCGLNGPVRLYVDGELIAEFPKLTTRRAKELGVLV